MAHDEEPKLVAGQELFGGRAPERYLRAAGAARFVLDGNGCFASSNSEFEKLYGSGTAAGERFDPSRIQPSGHVRTAVESALDGHVPERRLVLFPGSEDCESVWILEPIPFDAPQLAGGKGVAGVLVCCDFSSGSTSPEDLLMSVTLAERLAYERLGTAKAVVAKIRHEIGNALTTIIGNAELMIRKSPAADAATIERIQEIATQGRRIQQVIEGLDALSDFRTTNHLGGYEMLDLESGRET